MAQIDNSIYFQQQTPDIVGSVAQGLSMKDMLNKKSKQTALDNAYKAGVIQNQDGSTSYDRNLTLSALSKVGGKEFLEAKEKFQAYDLAEAENKRLKLRQDAEIVSSSLGAVNDQNSYERELNYLSQKGIDLGQMPRAYDPNFIKSARLKALTAKEQLDMMLKERELESKALDRRESRAMRFANQQATNSEKQLSRDEKKKSMLNEVEDRRTNIEDNITLLEDMVKDKGTYELFGSHNADMGRLVDQIATDMAKLTDPSSVARPSEVEMFKKGLVEPNMATTSNSTALDILKNFRGEVNKRAENAYKIRGVENPGSQPKEEFKVVNGKTYKKVPGGWEEVE